MEGLLVMFDRLVAASNEDPVTTIERVYGLMVAQFEAQAVQKGACSGIWQPKSGQQRTLSVPL